MDEEDKYSQATQLFSILVLKQEMAFYKKGLQQNIPDNIKEVFISQIQQMGNAMKMLVSKIESNQLTHDKYLNILQKNMQTQQDLLQQATKENKKQYVTRIESRINVYKQDMLGTNKDKQQWMQKLLIIGKQITQGNQQQETSVRQYQANITNMASIIDKQFVHQKVELLATRQIQYYNLGKYIQANLLDKKKSKYDYIMQLMGKFKDSLEKIKKDPTYPVGILLVQEAKEINVSEFHEMNQKQYMDKIKIMNTKFRECMKKEMEFKKLTHNVKKTQGFNPAQQSSERILQYQNDIKYIGELVKSPFTYLPDMDYQKEEIRELTYTNPDVKPHTMQFQILRLIGAKSDEYQISWSFSVNDQLFSEKTQFSDSSNVFNYTKNDIVIGSRQKPCYGIHEKKIQIQMVKKGTFFGTSDCGQGTISLTKLANQVSDQGTVDIVHKKDVFKLEYCVKIFEAEFPTKIPVESVRLSKIYPEFNLSSGIKEHVQRHISEIPQEIMQKALQDQQMQQLKLQQAKQNRQQQSTFPQNQNQQNQQTQQQQQQTQQQSQSSQQQQEIQYELISVYHTEEDQEVAILKSKVAEFPSDLTQDDVLIPDDALKNEAMSFIQGYKPIMEHFQKNAEEVSRKERKIARQMLDDIYRVEFGLPAKIQDGKLTAEEYLSNLKAIIKKDTKLSELYQKYNCKNHQQFVMARKQLIQKEIDADFGDQEEDQSEEQKTEEKPQQQQQKQQDQQQQVEKQPQQIQKNTSEQEEPSESNEINTELCLLEHAQNHETTQILVQTQESDYPSNLITIEDILLPENSERNVSLAYIEKLEPLLDQGLEKYTVEMNLKEKKAIKKLQEINYRMKTQLPESVQNGTLSMEQYIENLQQIIKRDKALEQFYLKKGIKSFAQFVQARQQIIQNELKEAGI